MRHTFALFGFAFGLFAVIAQGILSVSGSMEDGMGFWAALVRYLSYLTILTNCAIVMVFLAELTPKPRFLQVLASPFARATVASIITLVAVYYHLILAPDNDPQGMAALVDILLHYVCPFIFLAWIIRFNRTGTLKLTDALPMLVPPIIYCAYVLARGQVTGDYPYAIIDAQQYGYAAAFKGAGMIALALLALNFLYITLDRSVLTGAKNSS